MKGVPPSPGLAIKKHQSFFQTLVQTFLCTAYFAPLGKPKAEIGTEYPDLVLCGVLPPALSAKPSPIFSSDRRICAKRKEHPHLHSAVSASGIFTPFLCTLRHNAKPCSENMPYSFFQIYYELFCEICQ